MIPRIDVVNDSNDQDIMENMFKPFIGQCFLSEEEAFIFYKKA